MAKPELFSSDVQAKGWPGYGTNEWRRFETVDDARAAARLAREMPNKTLAWCGFFPKVRGETTTENTNSIPGKPPLQAKAENPPLLSISRDGVRANPDHEARPSGSAVASDPAPVGRTEIVQNRIASRLGPDGWYILSLLPHGELDRLTEFERKGELTDQMLELAISKIMRRAMR